MELDDWMIKDGLKYIVGTWQVDFLVNAFSNDLAHIPATEFKSEDGTDFTAITFEFFEDHTLIMKDTSKGKEEKGTWEQTGMTEFHYTLNSFLDLPSNDFLKAAETLQMQEGNLAFSIGFLCVSMKKIAEGVITEEKKTDIGDLEMSAEDASKMDILGRYSVYKCLAPIGDKLDLFTYDEVKSAIDSRLAAGEIDEDSAKLALQGFGTTIEFSSDHKLISWMKIPEGTPEDVIKKALESGEISAVKDGCFPAEQKQWKCIDGRFYYDSGTEGEVFGEKISPWKEFTADEEGFYKYADGMMILRKIEE